MSEIEQPLGRALLLRLEDARPLSALSPAWAGLGGLLASGSLQPDMQTTVAVVLVVLLVEPVMGGLWRLARDIQAGDEPASGGESLPAPVHLPYGRAGSAGERLAGWIARQPAAWRRGDGRAALVSVALALGIASVLGQAALVILAALAVLALRRRWPSGLPAVALASAYDMLLPWLVGLLALGGVTAQNVRVFAPVLAVAFVYTLVYAGCLALARGRGRGALVVVAAGQATILALLLARHETIAVWLLGLALIGQMTHHATFLREGDGAGCVKRSAVYIAFGMLAAAAALAPQLI